MCDSWYVIMFCLGTKLKGDKKWPEIGHVQHRLCVDPSLLDQISGRANGSRFTMESWILLDRIEPKLDRLLVYHLFIMSISCFTLYLHIIQTVLIHYTHFISSQYFLSRQEHLFKYFIAYFLSAVGYRSTRRNPTQTRVNKQKVPGLPH